MQIQGVAEVQDMGYFAALVADMVVTLGAVCHIQVFQFMAVVAVAGLDIVLHKVVMVAAQVVAVVMALAVEVVVALVVMVAEEQAYTVKVQMVVEDQEQEAEAREAIAVLVKMVVVMVQEVLAEGTVLNRLEHLEGVPFVLYGQEILVHILQPV
jgi:hypothetical protein